MPLTFKCKHCDRSLYIKDPESWIDNFGEIIKCKDCGKKTKIPNNAKIISEFDIPEKDKEPKKNKSKKSKIVDNKSKTNISKNNHSKTVDKYPVLHFISTLLKFTSILVICLSSYVFIKTLNTTNNSVLMLALPTFIYSIVSAICIYGYGELITLFIDVEKNTRKSK